MGLYKTVPGDLEIFSYLASSCNTCESLLRPFSTQDCTGQVLSRGRYMEGLQLLACGFRRPNYTRERFQEVGFRAGDEE